MYMHTYISIYLTGYFWFYSVWMIFGYYFNSSNMDFTQKLLVWALFIFVVINPRVLSVSQQSWFAFVFLFCFKKFPILPPSPQVARLLAIMSARPRYRAELATRSLPGTLALQLRYGVICNLIKWSRASFSDRKSVGNIWAVNSNIGFQSWT